MTVIFLLCYYLERTSVPVEETFHETFHETLPETLPETTQPILIERIHESLSEPIMKESPSPDYFLFDEDTGIVHKI
jgi:hypothetical protein